MKKTSKKYICGLCDGTYDDSTAHEHEHPEPQSGPFRTAWIASGLSYGAWSKHTKIGRAWVKHRKEMHGKDNKPITRRRGMKASAR